MGATLARTTTVRTGAERATLVRRTYATVFAGVLVTIAGTVFGLTQPRIMEAVAAHPFLTFLLVLGPLMLAGRTNARFPANAGLFALFTFVEGLWISPLVYFYSLRAPGILPQAAALTISTFGVLTLYAWVSRRDFSALGGFFSIGLWVLIGTSILNIFFRNQTADLWLAAATVFVFSGLLVFDTWRIRNVYGPDDYIRAAIEIYLDLLNLFLAILRLLGGRRS